MKTKHLLTFIFGVFMLLLNIDSASAQMIRYGIKGSVDISRQKGKSGSFNADTKNGFNIGGTLEASVPLTGLGIETGLYYGKKDYKAKEKDNGDDISDFNYLNVPIYLKQRFSLLGIVGMYFSGGVYGNFKLSGGDLEIDGKKYEQKGFQTGLGAGVGVNLISHLDLGVNYKYRLTDSYSDKIAKNFNKLDRSTWTLSLAYLF